MRTPTLCRHFGQLENDVAEAFGFEVIASLRRGDGGITSEIQSCFPSLVANYNQVQDITPVIARLNNLSATFAVPTLGGKDLKDLAFVIHGTSEEVRLAVVLDEPLVQAPTLRRIASTLLNSMPTDLGYEHWTKRFHQKRTVSWQISMYCSNRKSSTCGSDSG